MIFLLLFDSGINSLHCGSRPPGHVWAIPPGVTFCYFVSTRWDILLFCCWKILQCFFSEVHGAGRQLRVWHGRKGNNCHGPDRILGDDLYSGADQLLGPFESNINTWLLRWKMWTPSFWSLAKMKQTGGWTTRSRWWRKCWRRRYCQVEIQIIFILINCNQFSNLKLEIVENPTVHILL